jgi:lipopolysaccharide export system protein LptC
VSLQQSDMPRAVAEPLPATGRAQGRRDWSARARTDLRETERYTRFVVIAKRGLIGAAVILLAAVFAYSLQSRQHNSNRLAEMSFERLGIVNNDLAMMKPRLTGIDEEGDPYIVTAEVAVQDRLDEKKASLKNVQGDVTTKDSTWISGTAPSGTLDASRKLLTLWGGVSVFSDSGYEAHTTTADINMKTGMITGKHPVTGQGPLGTFRADRFKIDREKRLVYLYSNVHTIVYAHMKGGK